MKGGDAMSTELGQPDLSSLINGFLSNCEQRSLSSSTMEAYQIALRQFQSFLLSRDGTLSEANIAAYFDMIQSKFSQATFNQKYAIISLFLDFLAEEHIIPRNPTKQLSYKQIRQDYLAHTVEVEALTKILSCAHQRKALFSSRSDGRLYQAALLDVAVLELMILTGIRVSEISALAVEDVDLEKKTIRITDSKKHERVILIASDSTLRALTEYKNEFWLDMFIAGTFFVNRLGHPLSTQSVRNIVKRYAQQANISQTITPKNLRDSIATILLESGTSVTSLQQLMGHSCIDTTKKYIPTQEKQIIATPLCGQNYTKGA